MSPKQRTFLFAFILYIATFIPIIVGLKKPISVILCPEFVLLLFYGVSMGKQPEMLVFIIPVTVIKFFIIYRTAGIVLRSIDKIRARNKTL